MLAADLGLRQPASAPSGTDVCKPCETIGRARAHATLRAVGTAIERARTSPSGRVGIYVHPMRHESSPVRCFTVVTNAGGVDIPPITVKATASCCSARPRRELPHMHLRAGDLEAIRQRRLSGPQRTACLADSTSPSASTRTTSSTLRHGHTSRSPVARQPRPRAIARPQRVGRYGDRTVDEMAHAWVNCHLMNDDDYRARGRRRAATRWPDLD